jgi:membrane-bound serine protease (ClpP class)
MRRCNAARRLILAAVALLATVGVGWGQAQEERPANRGGPLVLLAAIEGAIGPGSVHHVEKVIEQAHERGAEVLILRLDTPGGLATSMRKIIAAILTSPVPVVGWVAPPGAHAASAGTYILYATHVAAMAPGTNLGAATPVQLGGGGLPTGEDDESKDEEGKDQDGGRREGGGKDDKVPKDAMEAKMVNDAVAFIRSLAELHGRNADWAEKAVREGASLSAEQALAEGVIELMAGDAATLIEKIDGREVTAGSARRTLATKGAVLEHLEPSFLTRTLSLLSDPNVAFLLLTIGIYGLIFEFSNPGSIGPGVIGAICLVLGLYALHQLPLDYAGLALLVLGIAFMVAEAVTPSLGVLGIGGLVAFIVGAAMLIDTDLPAYQLSWWAIGGAAAVNGLLLVFLLGYLLRAYRRRGPAEGSGLIGAQATVLDWSAATENRGEGHVWVHGERWAARGDPGLAPGQPVRVQALEGLTLVVGHADAAAAPRGLQPEGG